MALPKINRLASKGDIDRVFRNGRTVKGSFLFIRRLANHKERPRLAFIIPAKHVPLSANRNRLKRMLIEVSRKIIFSKFGWDLVVVLQRKAPREKFPEITQEFNNFLSKLS